MSVDNKYRRKSIVEDSRTSTEAILSTIDLLQSLLSQYFGVLTCGEGPLSRYSEVSTCGKFLGMKKSHQQGVGGFCLFDNVYLIPNTSSFAWIRSVIRAQFGASKPCSSPICATFPFRKSISVRRRFAISWCIDG